VPKKGWLDFDAAGWLFWTVVFLLALGPCLYGSWHLVYDDASRWIPLSMGFVFAALIAGFLSWAVNAVLQRRVKKRRLSERKKAKKQKG